jgi:hypothetical protein
MAGLQRPRCCSIKSWRKTPPTRWRGAISALFTSIYRTTRKPACFAKVLAVAPNDYATQFGLGLAAKHLGQLDEARTHFESACRVAPKAVQCRRELDALNPPPK